MVEGANSFYRLLKIIKQIHDNIQTESFRQQIFERISLRIFL